MLSKNDLKSRAHQFVIPFKNGLIDAKVLIRCHPHPTEFLEIGSQQFIFEIPKTFNPSYLPSNATDWSQNIISSILRHALPSRISSNLMKIVSCRVAERNRVPTYKHSQSHTYIHAYFLWHGKFVFIGLRKVKKSFHLSLKIIIWKVGPRMKTISPKR